MNWKELQERYPKSINLLEGWGNYPAVLSRQKFRLLYEFFDSHEIYVEIQLDRTLEVKYAPFVWYMPIPIEIEDYYREDYDYFQDDFLYKTRAESEDAAFTKAFEILENKLDGGILDRIISPPDTVDEFEIDKIITRISDLKRSIRESGNSTFYSDMEMVFISEFLDELKSIIQSLHTQKKL